MGKYNIIKIARVNIVKSKHHILRNLPWWHDVILNA